MQKDMRENSGGGMCALGVSQAEIFPIAMRVTVTCYQIIISHCRFMPVTHTKDGDSDKRVCVPLMWLLSVPDRILSLIFDFLHTLSFLSLPLLFSILPIASSHSFLILQASQIY